MVVKKNTGKLFVISAPSGAGKTTLVTGAIDRLKTDHDIQRVITYTSKQPRPGERHAIDYYFVTEAEFVEKIEEGFFVEHSTVYGAYYGFPRDVLTCMERGSSYVAIVDRAGAASLKAHIKDAVLVWIEPPDKKILEQRLEARAQDSKEAIAFRLSLAQEELGSNLEEIFHHVLVNDELEKALDWLEELIKKELAERR